MCEISRDLIKTLLESRGINNNYESDCVGYVILTDFRVHVHIHISLHKFAGDFSAINAQSRRMNVTRYEFACSVGVMNDFSYIFRFRHTTLVILHLTMIMYIFRVVHFLVNMNFVSAIYIAQYAINKNDKLLLQIVFDLF